jgi:tetratricopeptide (TPR) repeat protein
MLGAALGRAGELDAAIEAYEQSISLKPTALACKTLAALVFERRKDAGRAVALWRQSLALDPNQPDVTVFLRRYAR